MVELPKNGNVVIIGYAASGKTHFANSLDCDVIHTDDYIKYGFEDSLYVLMDEYSSKKGIFKRTGVKVFEGILGYRLLRKGVQLNTFKAELIIIVEADAATRQQRIIARGKNVQSTFNLDRVCDKIWLDYVNSVKKLPTIIKIKGV